MKTIWRYGKFNNYEYFDIECDGNTVCSIYSGIENTIEEQKEAEETAAFIVKACNSHKELVEALQTAMASLATYGSHPLIEAKANEALRKTKN